jgi:putative tricarboxylic transport membrane protein
MNEKNHVQERWMELVVALFFAIIATLVIVDSYRVGNAWSSEGPQPGYFTFYIGCVLIAGALYVAVQTLLGWKKDDGETAFVEREALSLVLKMFVPTVAYVAAIMLLGFYVPSIIFIAAFMMWQGKYSTLKSGAVGIGVAAVLWALFEIWFLVPLPKGPLEVLFGY